MIDSSADGGVVAPVPAVIEQNNSGVVWVLAETLARHSLNGAYCLGCDWQMPSMLSSWEDQHRLHQASMVAALPNIATEWQVLHCLPRCSGMAGSGAMRDILTAGSYYTSTGRLHGTNCPCGVSCGPDKGHFCTGFSGCYDTYMCQCDCHDGARAAGGQQ